MVFRSNTSLPSVEPGEVGRLDCFLFVLRFQEWVGGPDERSVSNEGQMW